MAKIASAFCDPPGMEALREFQQKMEKIYNPSWMKGLEQCQAILRQISGSMDTFQSIQSAAINQAAAAAQAFAVEMEQSSSWINAIKSSLDYSHVMKLALEEQTTLSLAVPIAELQSTLLNYMSEWSAISEEARGISLALQKEYAVAHACTLAESISNLVDEEEEASDNLPTELTDEDEHIIAEEISSVLASKQNWEQRLMESVTKLKETHPILARLFFEIIISILTSIIISLASIVIGQIRTPAKVYVKPQTTSQVIYRLEPLQQVKIIGEQPYYFQIELTDNNTQETLVGFVSKRSIEQVDAQGEASAMGAPD